MARRGEGPRLRYRRGAWVIRWTEGGQTRERRTGATSRENAEAVFAEWLIGQRQRPQGPRRATEYLIADCLTDYTDERGPKLGDERRLLECVDRLLDWWDDRPISEINKTMCEQYADHRKAQGCKDGTIRLELSKLSAALKHAEAQERLLERPTVWLPPLSEPRDRWLTRSEVAKLLRAARSHDKRVKSRKYLPWFILIAVYGGARPGAVLGLQWQQIDLDRGLINWNEAGRVQTNKRRPKTRVPKRLVRFLRYMKKYSGSEIGPVLTFQGKPIKSIKKRFAEIVKDAGLEGWVTPHTLRHTCATWLAQGGVDIWKVAGYLGHTDSRTTGRYAHHHPDYQSEVADALDKGN